MISNLFTAISNSKVHVMTTFPASLSWQMLNIKNYTTKNTWNLLTYVQTKPNETKALLKDLLRHSARKRTEPILQLLDPFGAHSSWHSNSKDQSL